MGVGSAIGVDACPTLLLPQHDIAPSVRRPQVCLWPTAMEVNLSLEDGEDWSPQQTAVPSERSPQVWLTPASMAVNVSRAGALTPDPVVPQHLGLPFSRVQT